MFHQGQIYHQKLCFIEDKLICVEGQTPALYFWRSLKISASIGECRRVEAYLAFSLSLDDPLRHWRKYRKRDCSLAINFMGFAYTLLSVFDISATLILLTSIPVRVSTTPLGVAVFCPHAEPIQSDPLRHLRNWRSVAEADPALC